MPRPEAEQPADGRDKIAEISSGPNDPCAEHIKTLRRLDKIIEYTKAVVDSMIESGDLPSSSDHQRMLHELRNRIEDES